MPSIGSGGGGGGDASVASKKPKWSEGGGFLWLILNSLPINNRFSFWNQKTMNRKAAAMDNRKDGEKQKDEDAPNPNLPSEERRKVIFIRSRL
uniref:Uncharacterized protein n=1 Tax=Picea sitchensis TaxID=3332 RepID=A9NYU4_PICSI|nr:unknown [Picea sitchensis]